MKFGNPSSPPCGLRSFAVARAHADSAADRFIARPSSNGQNSPLAASTSVPAGMRPRGTAFRIREGDDDEAGSALRRGDVRDRAGADPSGRTRRAGDAGQFSPRRVGSLFLERGEGRWPGQIPPSPRADRARPADRHPDEPRHALFRRRVRPRRRPGDNHAARRRPALRLHADHRRGGLHARSRLRTRPHDADERGDPHALCSRRRPHFRRRGESERHRGGPRVAGRHQGRAAGRARRLQEFRTGTRRARSTCARR